MDFKDNSDLSDNSQKERILNEIPRVFNELSEQGASFDPREIELAGIVTDVVFETELPEEKFNIPDITSTTNKSVEGKMTAILSNAPLVEHVLPSWLVTDQYPLSFDANNLEVAPWVNMVHAWGRVLNCMNTVSAMQRGDILTNPDDIVAITHVLFNSTTEAKGRIPLRNSKDFLDKFEYPETKLRKSGTKGINAERYVCYEEMKYILDVIRNTYSKK